MAVSEKAAQFMQGNMERGQALPGQSLTNSPEEPYKWEKSPEFTDSKEAMLYVFETLTQPDTTTNILLSLSKGVGVIDIASITLYSGFTEGKWNPDLMTLLMEPVMYMIMALAEKAEIDFVVEAGDDEISPQSVPTDVREIIEQTDIAPSILEKVEQSTEQNNNSLLAKEV